MLLSELVSEQESGMLWACLLGDSIDVSSKAKHAQDHIWITGMGLLATLLGLE